VGLLEGFWHLLNFFAPAFAVGLLTAAASKLIWRQDLRSLSWLRLGAWASVSGAVALVAALVVLGRDGRMAGYAMMLFACAFSLWWVGLRAPRS
jgi:hypothetical protein